MDDEHVGNGSPHSRQTGLAVVAIVALALAYASVVQGTGWTQASHYALVRSLVSGTARIDAYQRTTGDKAYQDGHYYSIKAPGLALVSLPPYLVVRATGADRSHETAVWLLDLFTILPLAVVLLVLVYRVADTLEPGTGTLAAFALGASTLVLPFATLYFSHVAAATVGFAAFFVLFRAREGPTHLAPIVLSGLLAGLACVFEYPMAIVAVALFLYAVGRDRLWGRVVAYGLGGLVGLSPLLAYNTWAFGGPLRLSYAHAVIDGGASGHDVVGAHDHGIFGITQPSLRAAALLASSNRGFLTLTPVVLVGLAGAVVLYRRGRRTEGTLALGLAVAFLLFNAGLTTEFGGPFGGGSPGPRYLIPALPFALMAIGLAYRRAPGTTIALLLVSLSTMALATITAPMSQTGEVSLWARDAVGADFESTIVSLLGGPGGVASILPFVLALGVALVATAASLPLRSLGRRDLAEGAVAFVLWLVVAYGVRMLVVPPPDLASAGLALTPAAGAIAAQAAIVRPFRDGAGSRGGSGGSSRSFLRRS